MRSVVHIIGTNNATTSKQGDNDMQNFTWHNPTELIFGKDTVKELAPRLKTDGIKGVLLVFGGKGTFKSGAYAQATDMLNSAGISFSEVNDVKSNPLVGKVREGIQRVKAGGIDAVMPVGGGSVFDTAKAIAAGSLYSGDVWDFYLGKAEPEKMLPVASVLTIPAAGSEMSESSVITNEDGDVKVGYSNNLSRPKFAILNPRRTMTLPPYQTAAGVTDMMMHTMERYFTKDDDMDFTLIWRRLRCVPSRTPYSPC